MLDGVKSRGGLELSESISEPDLTTAHWKPWYAGFPPGVTVDELRWYRKKKPPGDWGPRDNLKLEEGSMKKFKSEYKRRFKKFNFLPASNEDLTTTPQDDRIRMRRRIRPLDYLKLEGDLEYHPEYKELFIEYPAQRPTVPRPRGSLGLETGSMDLTSEQHDKYVPFQGVPRAQIARRSSSLQREGEFMVKSSEMHSQFVKFDDAKRADLLRKPPNLQLEGDMSVTSETADKFIEFARQKPEPVKAPANLKLEGDMDVLTEKREKYVPFQPSRRPPLSKQPTNLQLEGPMEIQSEKQDKFVPYNVQERPSLAKRDTTLHLEGDMVTKTEKQDKFVPFNLEKRPALAKRDTNLHLEGEMDTRTEKKEKYVPFELSSRQKIAKRPTNLQLGGEMDIQSEKSAKYTPFQPQKRPPLVKKDTNLHLEGSLNLTPEYRDQFIGLQTERAKPTRPVNNLGLDLTSSQSSERIKDNFFTEYKKPYRDFDLKPEDLKHKENHVPTRSGRAHSQKRRENLKGDVTTQLSTNPAADQNNTSATESDGAKITQAQNGDNSSNLGGEGVDSGAKNSGEITTGKSAKVEEISSHGQQKRARGHAQAGNLKSEGRMATTPEYRSSYVDLPRARPVLRKPESTLRIEGKVSHISEKESQYVQHENVQRPPLAKREDELKMEGRLECQPEYRKAYIDFLTRENMARKPRPFDSLNGSDDVHIEYAEGNPVVVVDSASVADKTKSGTSKAKQKSSKSTKGAKSKPPSGKSRSVSPDRRRKTRQVPRTPQQQRVLVPDISGISPRRPSSIFGPKTGRWYPRPVTPPCQSVPCDKFENMEDPYVNYSPRHCVEHHHPCRCCPRWESPCRKWEWRCGERYSPERHSPRRSSPRMASPRVHRRSSPNSPRITFQRVSSPRVASPRRSPSPPRRQMWSKEHQSRKLDEKPASFVVLTDKVEINNNRLRDNLEGNALGRCCKEQKWMPPWYEPPM